MTRFAVPTRILAAVGAGALALAATAPLAAQDSGDIEAGTPAPAALSKGEKRLARLGDTIFVQRTRDPARIDASDTLVTNRFGPTQICRLDMMTTIDRFTGIFTGSVFFVDFVPYTRIKAKG